MYKPVFRMFLVLLFNGLVSDGIAQSNASWLEIPSSPVGASQSLIKLTSTPLKTSLQFSVWLKVRHKKALEERVEAIYNPDSPQYQSFLTIREYERDFAPTKADEKAVADYFIAQGMDVRIKPHRIMVTASVAQINQALGTKMNYYLYHQKRVIATASPPKLPRSIAERVSGLSGLSTIPRFMPFEPYHAKPVSDAHQNSNGSPFANPTITSLSGFTGQHLQTAYNIANLPLINGSVLDGRGQTLVILDGCGENSAQQILNDANQFFAVSDIKPFKMSGTDVNFAVINPDGTPFSTCANPGDWDGEIALDVQSSHTIAPGANTVLVLTPSANLEAAQIEVIDTLISNNYSIAGFDNAYVLSQSFGGIETGNEQALEEALLRAAAFGLSVNFSSGDCGDYNYDHGERCQAQGSPRVSYPASSTYVTALGATGLFVDDAWQYAFENVWGTYRDGQFAGGTGGGISQFYGPVSWQNPIRSFSAGGYGLISENGFRRALPDISMLGDPETGLRIYVNGNEVQDGGTSLACPLFSASLTLVNQARFLLNKATPIGLAAPYLYQQNQTLLNERALNLIVPPHQIIPGAVLPPAGAPNTAFTIDGLTFGWDSSLTIAPEAQFWNDAVGVGSPYLPNFVMTMAQF